MRVDFYILPDATDQGRLRLACKLAEKAYDNGHRVYVLAADAAQAGVLDELLWTFRQNSFVPHARYPVPADETAPVWISSDPPPQQADDVLINLTADLPPRFEQFQRILELVDQHPDVLAASRQRFRAYRAQGIEPASYQRYESENTKEPKATTKLGIIATATDHPDPVPDIVGVLQRYRVTHSSPDSRAALG